MAEVGGGRGGGISQEDYFLLNAFMTAGEVGRFNNQNQTVLVSLSIMLALCDLS